MFLYDLDDPTPDLPQEVVLSWADAVLGSLKAALDGASPLLDKEHLVPHMHYNSPYTALDLLTSPAWFRSMARSHHWAKRLPSAWLDSLSPHDLAEAVLAHSQLTAAHLDSFVFDTVEPVRSSPSFISLLLSHPSCTDEVLASLATSVWGRRLRPKRSAALALLSSRPLVAASLALTALPHQDILFSFADDFLPLARRLAEVPQGIDLIPTLAEDLLAHEGRALLYTSDVSRLVDLATTLERR